MVTSLDGTESEQWKNEIDVHLFQVMMSNNFNKPQLLSTLVGACGKWDPETAELWGYRFLDGNAAGIMGELYFGPS